MAKKILSLCGDREKWLAFTYACKLNKQQVWNVLLPHIEEYLKRTEENATTANRANS